MYLHEYGQWLMTKVTSLERFQDFSHHHFQMVIDKPEHLVCYVTKECRVGDMSPAQQTGIPGCSTSPGLYGTPLNIPDEQGKCGVQQTLRNIGDVDHRAGVRCHRHSMPSPVYPGYRFRGGVSRIVTADHTPRLCTTGGRRACCGFKMSVCQTRWRLLPTCVLRKEAASPLTT